jgi:hypothetical protein
MSQKNEGLLAGDRKAEDIDKPADFFPGEFNEKHSDDTIYMAAPVKRGFAATGESPSLKAQNAAIRFSQKSYGNLSTLRYFRNSLQTKLSIGKSDDPYEREADRIADEITHAQEKKSIDNDSTITLGAQRSIQKKPT